MNQDIVSDIKRSFFLEGIVVSDKMDKSIVVRVERRVPHPVYKKIVRVHKKFMAHDENNSCKIGDEVKLKSSRPLSARKRWILDKIVNKKSGEKDL